MKATIHLARMYYPVHTLGPGDRIGIWLAGCDRGCPECIAPELQKCDNGTPVTIDEVMGYIRTLCDRAEGITISGGEPFFFPEELHNLTHALSEISDDVILFTGYTMAELKEMRDENVDGVLKHISVLIDGPYIGERNDGRGLRGSSNQTIHILRHAERYPDLETCERSMQLVIDNNRVMTIGIPWVKNDDKQ